MIKPPIGVVPRSLWLEQRRDDLRRAITAYENAYSVVASEWRIEEASIEEELRKNQPHPAEDHCNSVEITDPHIALMEAEHDDRMQLQPAEDPDEWVIQNRVPIRVQIDRCWYMDGECGLPADPEDMWQKYNKDQFLDGKKHGDYVRDGGGTLYVMCRRRDLPKVEQVEQAKQCISHDEHRGEWRCKNAALPGKDYCSECADDPQPQKTRVRLWKNAYGSVMSNPDCENIEGWQEIRVDSEGFYVEGGQS